MISVANVHATVGEFQRNYLYKFFIETVPTAIISKFFDALHFQSNVDVYDEKAIFPDRVTSNKQIRWSGEYFYVPTVDNSTREQEFTFYLDEPMKVYDFFSACKDLTGNEINQAGVVGVASKFNVGVALVSVDKQTITAYRRLKGCRVYSVKVDDLDKGAEDVSKLTVKICWDFNEEDKSKRGKTV